MAGLAASKTIPFGPLGGPETHTSRVIQIKAPIASALNDAARPAGEMAGLTAPEGTQP